MDRFFHSTRPLVVNAVCKSVVDMFKKFFNLFAFGSRQVVFSAFVINLRQQDYVKFLEVRHLIHPIGAELPGVLS